MNKAKLKSYAPQARQDFIAADFSAKSYLETEADVEVFVTQLRSELLTTVRAGQKVRLQ